MRQTPLYPIRQPLDATPPGAATEVEWRGGLRARIDGAVVRLEGQGGELVLAGLPFAAPGCLAAGGDGSLWVGSAQGVARWVAGRWEVYSGPRWLPSDAVLALRAGDGGGCDVFTAAGAVRLSFEPWSLAARAEHYERLTDARHRRRGYVTACTLERLGDLTSWRPNIEDNDGLWTAMYAAAEALRFAVTGATDAREKARESLRALLLLEQITPLAGYPARAVTHCSEPEFGRHDDGEWHLAAGGEWEWKGDTSSDELDGHYFAWPLLHDLVADAAERQAIVATVRRVTDHLLDHGLHLVDLDGQPTRWGVWSPQRLNDDPRWRAERGLNSLEILGYLAVAEYLCGDARYAAATRELVEQHHYALNTVEQKVRPGDFAGAEENFSDDELAFLAYYALLRQTRDEARRPLYLASLERTWQLVRRQRCPLWNLVYSALSGRPGDLEVTLEALHEIPLDLIDWPTDHRARVDLEFDPAVDRFGRQQLGTPLPWRERPLHKWNGNPFRLAGGSGHSEECGTFWLLPYWLGRYHGLIDPD
ncbi:MAG: hypothetical protein IT204_07515 [Fimbriimonadaceae bacterium]|nr:hypothetical protein [Fimbriimonadaceae bacterium]